MHIVTLILGQIVAMLRLGNVSGYFVSGHAVHFCARRGGFPINCSFQSIPISKTVGILHYAMADSFVSQTAVNGGLVHRSSGADTYSTKRGMHEVDKRRRYFFDHLQLTTLTNRFVIQLNGI